MKNALFLLGLLLCGTTDAQTVQPPLRSGSVMAKPVHYLYAELIGSHLPSHKKGGVIFDFGQATAAWSYNWVTDEQGRKIRFDSMVEALNYMIRQRWEFVQAYSSGSDSEYVHYLLRIRAEDIPESLRKQLPPVPDGAGTGSPEVSISAYGGESADTGNDK